MTIYTYSREAIICVDGHTGWMNSTIHNKFDCVMAIRNILQNNGHELKVELYMSSVGDYVQVEPIIREVEAGYYITDMFDELNYAFFSKDMKCAKSCAKAVLEVMQS